MKLKLVVLIGVVVAATVAAAAVAGPAVPKRAGASPGLAAQGVVWHGNDLGAGERILLVVGGAFTTREEAERAARRTVFGDLQGYYVAATDQFVGLRDDLGAAAADYVLATAFRTEEGAVQFLELARAVDAPALLTPRLENLGFEYVGLGQEPAPDGSGPLVGPLPGVSTP